MDLADAHLISMCPSLSFHFELSLVLGHHAIYLSMKFEFVELEIDIHTWIIFLNKWLTFVMNHTHYIQLTIYRK